MASNIEEMIIKTEKFLSLLKDAQPGLISWNQMFRDNLRYYAEWYFGEEELKSIEKTMKK